MEVEVERDDDDGDLPDDSWADAPGGCSAAAGPSAAAPAARPTPRPMPVLAPAGGAATPPSGSLGALIDEIVAAGLLSRDFCERMAEEPWGEDELSRLLRERRAAAAGKDGTGGK